jgi:hypothetical protein
MAKKNQRVRSKPKAAGQETGVLILSYLLNKGDSA